MLPPPISATVLPSDTQLFTPCPVPKLPPNSDRLSVHKAHFSQTHHQSVCATLTPRQTAEGWEEHPRVPPSQTPLPSTAHALIWRRGCPRGSLLPPPMKSRPRKSGVRPLMCLLRASGNSTMKIHLLLHRRLFCFLLRLQAGPDGQHVKHLELEKPTEQKQERELLPDQHAHLLPKPDPEWTLTSSTAEVLRHEAHTPPAVCPRLLREKLVRPHSAPCAHLTAGEAAATRGPREALVAPLAGPPHQEGLSISKT